MAETSPGDDVMELELEEKPETEDITGASGEDQDAGTNGTGHKNDTDTADGEDDFSFTGPMSFGADAPEVEAAGDLEVESETDSPQTTAGSDDAKEPEKAEKPKTADEDGGDPAGDMLSGAMTLETPEDDGPENGAGAESKEAAPGGGENGGPEDKSENAAADEAISGAEVPEDGGVSQPKTKRIGERLIEQGLITEDQLKVALHEKQKSPKMLGEIMVELGFISPDVLSGFLAESTGYEEFNPKKAMLDPEALDLIGKKEAQKFNILPVSIDKKRNEAHIAMADPYDVVALDRLRQILPRTMHIVPQVCSPAVIGEAIDNAYGYASSIDGILKELAGEDVSELDVEGLSEDQAYTHPLVRLVNALVFEGVKIGASDIHIEPEENFIRLRYRLDGVLHTKYTLHREYWNGISQRIKIVSGMNIADKMLPQDGRFSINIGGREADFRVSSLPTVFGENIVLRILDKSTGIMPMEALGFSDHNMALIKKSQSKPEGIIIVTGPTGSGKTTSLYSMLNSVNTPDVNIMTLEDPVEYELPLIRQTHVKESTGLTFGEGVKALLRQDPDIIFVGEVRDQPTAEQALKAAMTGHQVYTTLHTNDCFGAIPRLLDLGMKPGMLAGAIVATFAQRLARRLCENCKKEHVATEEECKILGVDPSDPPTIYEAGGCPECMDTGYKGRIAVVEILYMDDELNDLVAENAHKSQLKKTAVERGFKSMLDDGLERVLQGVTSLDALSKVVSLSDRM